MNAADVAFGPDDPVYEVVAIRYATRETTKAACYFGYHAYGEPDEPYVMDYFFWLLRGGGRTVLVDTGAFRGVVRDSLHALYELAGRKAKKSVPYRDVNRQLGWSAEQADVDARDSGVRSKGIGGAFLDRGAFQGSDQGRT